MVSEQRKIHLVVTTVVVWCFLAIRHLIGVDMIDDVQNWSENPIPRPETCGDRYRCFLVTVLTEIVALFQQSMRFFFQAERALTIVFVSFNVAVVTKSLLPVLAKHVHALCRGRMCTSMRSTMSEESHQGINSLLYSSVRQRVLTTWNRRIHREVIGHLEFEFGDVPTRVRALMARFDSSTTFGQAVLEGLRETCMRRTNGEALPCSQSSRDEEEYKRFQDMWSDVLCFLDSMCLDIEEKGDQIEHLHGVRRVTGEELLVFLARYFVIYERQCSEVKEAKAISILIPKLDREFVRFLRNQSSTRELSFSSITQYAKQYLSWRQFDEPHRHRVTSIDDETRLWNKMDNTSGERAEITPQEGDIDPWERAQVESVRRPSRYGIKCFACGKYGHIARFCKSNSRSYASLSLERKAQERDDVYSTEDYETTEKALLHIQVLLRKGQGPSSKHRCLVDTGSAVNLIIKTLCGYDGKCATTKGSITLDVIIGSETRSLVFEVSKENCEIIIGKKGLGAFGVSIDCDENSLTFRGGKKVFCHAVRDPKKANKSLEMEPDVEHRVLNIVEDESRGAKPYRRQDVIFCPLGKSLIIPPFSTMSVQLPYHVANREVMLSGLGNGSKGVVVIGAIKMRGHPLRFQVMNTTPNPEQIGARNGIVSFVVPTNMVVQFEDINGVTCLINDNSRVAVQQVDEIKDVNYWSRKFPSVLQNPLGKVKHYEINNAQVRAGVNWNKMKAKAYSRAETLALKPLVKELVDLDVVERTVKRPTLLTPLLTVPKRDGRQRLVLDFRLLNAVTNGIQNNALDRFRLLGSVPKNVMWSSFDLSKGYQQLSLTPSIRRYFGFELDKEWFQFKRCPFGWINASSHFGTALDMTMQKVKKDLPVGASLLWYVDDILLGTMDEETHDKAIEVLLHHLDLDGWTVNGSKSVWKAPSVQYLGRCFDRDGVRPSPGLVQSIQDLKKPTNAKELRTFFGLMAQLEMFQWKQHEMLEELRGWLKRKPSDFQSAKFDKVWKSTTRDVATNISTLGYWNPDGALEMLVDASGVGIGAVLMCDHVPVAMFSRRTSKEWQHSSDSEIDGMLKALEAFEMYTTGKQVKVYTDNWSAYRSMNTSKLSHPIRRRLDRLLHFHPNVTFLSGKENKLADFLSREQYLLRNNEDKKPHTVSTISKSRDQIIYEAHCRGHVGVAATKAILQREGYSCKGWTSDIARVIRCCEVCQKFEKRKVQEPLGFNEAKEVSGVVGIDFLGPLKGPKHRKGKYLTVMVDGLTRYMEVFPATGPTTKEAMKSIRRWERTHGNISRLISDSGSAFKSLEFRNFCKSRPMDHIMSCANHHSSNGLIERAIGTLIQRLQKMGLASGKGWWAIYKEAVKVYNSTPHGVTSYSPHELRYGPNPQDGRAKGLRWRQDARNRAMNRTRGFRKKWQDQRKKEITGKGNFQPGERVLVHISAFGKSGPPNKFSPSWEGPFTIHEVVRVGVYKVRTASGSKIIHGDLMKRFVS
eukprot:g3811.t1